ncbi:MAG TPA: alpha/beta hydrolase fold domain-containing protein [Solirubrobacteraceae bacterium]|nr:alpha/beta hydrolase fold domain-containing protein [Solirubrobacteraceae bacterium]
MASGDIELVRELIALQAPLRAMPLVNRRRQYDYADIAMGEDAPPGEMVDAGGCAAEWVLARQSLAQPVLVYLHGGGYSLGSSRSHRHLAAAIGRVADVAVLSVDYRRAPEFAFPAAVDDTVTAIRWLLERTNAPVVLAGDSAGGGLVVAGMIALRDAGLPLPAAGVCLSPWVDLTGRADAHVRLAERDPLLSSVELKRMADAYLRDADPHQRLASPVFADLSGLPPLLIQVGTEEILLDDARTLADAARRARVEVRLEEWSEMIHAWHWYFPVLDEGRRAIIAIGEFIRDHATSECMASELRKNDRTCTAPASSMQEAHLLIAELTSGHGYLDWVYQLNGLLDIPALARAVDDVVYRHEILRTRFESHNGRVCQVLTPFAPEALEVVDLGERTKQEGLDAAIDDVRRLYGSLSSFHDSRFRATLYTIDAKTSVLAMFVAEALVDSDSGSLLAADIARAYARHHGSPVPAGLPMVRDAPHADGVVPHPPDPDALARARKHWMLQAQNALPLSGWPTTARNGGTDRATVAFEFPPAEWTRVVSGTRVLGSTPYAFVLTCLQAALARAANVWHFLAHSVVSVRSDMTEGVIGNFHSLVRIDMQLAPDATFESALARTAAAVGEALEHCVVPAPLTEHGTLTTLPTGGPLPDIRFYMFANHEGPVFAGIRRRRFRLHGGAPAPLSVNCIYAPNGRQDFVFSSTTATADRLEHLARTVRAIVHEEVEKAHMSV